MAGSATEVNTQLSGQRGGRPSEPPGQRLDACQHLLESVCKPGSVPSFQELETHRGQVFARQPDFIKLWYWDWNPGPFAWQAHALPPGRSLNLSQLCKMAFSRVTFLLGTWLRQVQCLPGLKEVLGDPQHCLNKVWQSTPIVQYAEGWGRRTRASSGYLRLTQKAKSGTGEIAQQLGAVPSTHMANHL